VSDLAAALQIAIRVHAAQTDKAGAPYLWHIARVVEAVSDEAKVVAALHDAVEDAQDRDAAWTWITTADLSSRENDALDLLTRVKGETYREYISDLITNPLAREVKLADLRDNLGRIPPEPLFADDFACVQWGDKWASLKARYEKAVEVLEGGDAR
jgi:(p)ppGpp synthase/HD superfamily hydrolase